MSDEGALLELLQQLKAQGYHFTAVTPATHARVLTRPCPRPGLRDIFGWNRSFSESDLTSEVLDCAERAGILERAGNALRSNMRVASLGPDLFLHSAFPTDEPDAVFFGPDTYRFVRFVGEELRRLTPEPSFVVDMGSGSGAGAIAAAHLLPNARIVAVDVNAQALQLAAVNARAAGVNIETHVGSEIPSGADLVIANPPYIMDASRRTYRDGGELFGGQIAFDWARQALRSLVPGRAMLLYSGAAVVDGDVPLIAAVQQLCTEFDAELEIAEADPDVFGEELNQPAYSAVERIAVLHIRIRKLFA